MEPTFQTGSGVLVVNLGELYLSASLFVQLPGSHADLVGMLL